MSLRTISPRGATGTELAGVTLLTNWSLSTELFGSSHRKLGAGVTLGGTYHVLVSASLIDRAMRNRQVFKLSAVSCHQLASDNCLPLADLGVFRQLQESPAYLWRVIM